MSSENEKLGIKVNVETNEYQDEEQIKYGSNFDLSVEKIVVEEIIYHKEDDYIPKMKINKKNIAKKRDINQVQNDENFFKTLGKSPLSRLMIWDHLKKKAVTCMSVNFKDEAIDYVLEHLGVIKDQLTDNSLKSLEEKIKTFHGDLRARMKKMRGKYQDYRDRVVKNYLSKLLNQETF